MDCLTETTENINCIILKGHKIEKAFLDCRACALEEGTTAAMTSPVQIASLLVSLVQSPEFLFVNI